MKTCEVCGKPIPRTSKTCADCDSGSEIIDAPEEESVEVNYDIDDVEPEED